MQRARTAIIFALVGLFALSGCALPEGAITVNAEISKSVKDQQAEVEKALKWAFQPYYDQLEAKREPVHKQALAIEMRARAEEAWRNAEIQKVQAAMANDTITASAGIIQLNALKTAKPSDAVLNSLVGQTALPAEAQLTLADAVNARYEIAKEALDAELNKVIAQLRQNTSNIVAANDKISAALEQQRNSLIQGVKVAKAALGVVSTIFPGASVLTGIIDNFANSNLGS